MRWVEPPAEEKIHRQTKETAVNELVNRKTDKMMKIARRANRKAQDNLLHRWRLDKGVTHKILSRLAFHRGKAMRIVRQGKFP